mgnify:CR=1 FL=1
MPILFSGVRRVPHNYVACRRDGDDSAPIAAAPVALPEQQQQQQQEFLATPNSMTAATASPASSTHTSPCVTNTTITSSTATPATTLDASSSMVAMTPPEAAASATRGVKRQRTKPPVVHSCAGQAHHKHGPNCGHRCAGVAVGPLFRAFEHRSCGACVVFHVMTGCWVARPTLRWRRAVLQSGKIGFLLPDGKVCFETSAKVLPESDVLPSGCRPVSRNIHDAKHVHAPGCGHPMVHGVHAKDDFLCGALCDPFMTSTLLRVVSCCGGLLRGCRVADSARRSHRLLGGRLPPPPSCRWVRAPWHTTCR